MMLLLIVDSGGLCYNIRDCFPACSIRAVNGGSGRKDLESIHMISDLPF